MYCGLLLKPRAVRVGVGEGGPRAVRVGAGEGGPRVVRMGVAGKAAKMFETWFHGEVITMILLYSCSDKYDRRWPPKFLSGNFCGCNLVSRYCQCFSVVLYIKNYCCCWNLLLSIFLLFLLVYVQKLRTVIEQFSSYILSLIDVLGVTNQIY